MSTLMKTLWLIRGVPGCGKTTLATQIAKGLYGDAWDDECPPPANDVFVRIHEANDYFYVNGEWRFDLSRVPEAFDDCLDRTNKAMAEEVTHVFVTNPFPKLQQMVPYEQLAKKYGYTVNIITCNTFHRNVHNVPIKTMQTMRTGFEHPKTNIL